MADTGTLPEQTCAVGDSVGGYEVRDVRLLEDIGARGYLLEHVRTGARLLHVHSSDPEKLLAVALRTPPPDDTGLPHILEHTVLCGSEKYPVKDPFVELIRTSMATFINAMTYPDRTAYPCASMVEKDFFNLASVYCDAVFHPLVTEEHFKQEGHHFDFAVPGDPSSPLVIKGIVFNEMKGAYSDLDGILYRELDRAVTPDTPYGRDSGGDPHTIPSLTYEDFLAFHRRYYHPSNAFVFHYGDIPTERICGFLEENAFDGFERIAIDTTIPLQPRWGEPRTLSVRYPVGRDEPTEKKTALAAAWLANDALDGQTTMAMRLLSDYLVGNEAAPLRKALIESRLGEDLAHSGYSDGERDTTFVVGLKGSEADRADAMLDVVRETLEPIVRDGLDREKLDAAFHQFELGAREVGGMFPLRLMDRAFRSWMYGGDPFQYLRLSEQLAEMRRRYEETPRYFEEILREHVLDNPHRIVVVAEPDREYTARLDREWRERLDAMKADMDSETLDRIAEEAQRLDAAQSAPNPPEALASLPRLAVDDIPEEPFDIDTTEETVGETPFVGVDMFSNGMSYLKLAVDVSGLDDELLDVLPLYCECVSKMGAAGDDYAATAEREARHTGGVHAGLSIRARVDDIDSVRPRVVFSGKALDRELDEMTSLFADKLFDLDLDDADRLRDIILQARTRARSHLVPGGWSYAASYASRTLSRNAALNERTQGVTQVRYLTELADDVDARLDETAERLRRIGAILSEGKRYAAAFLGDASAAGGVRERVGEWAARSPGEAPPPERTDVVPEEGTREGLAVPSDVAFVTRVFRTVGMAHRDAAALTVLSTQLSFGYLWEEVRAKRGAYGVRAGYDPLDGLFSFRSYRDPNVASTLEVYARIFDHIETEMDLSDDAVEQAVIGAMKTVDRPIRPAQACGTALSRHLAGDSRAFREEYRKRLLAVTGDDLRRVAAEHLRPHFEASPVCVLSSREKLENAAAELGEKALRIEDV